jgi:hypothetical protein
LASSLHSAAALAFLALCSVSRGEAQGLVVSGVLQRVEGADTVPVPARWVVLHAVTVAEGGPVDSQRTDANGRFRLRLPAVDTSANYLLSAQHQGIGYFSPAIDPDSLRAGDVPPLLVYDTASGGDALELAERHLLVRSPGSDGRRRVIELFVLANRGTTTRVVGESEAPVWQVTIPPDAEDVEIGASDLAGDAIEIGQGTLDVFAPVVPGEREVLIGYLVPAGRAEFSLTLDQPVTQLSVLLGDSSAMLEAPPLPLMSVEQLEGQPLRRYGGDAVSAGMDIRIRFGNAPAPFPLQWIVVPFAVVVMAVGFVVWRRRVAAPAPMPNDPTQLAARIAALDAEYRGRDDEGYRQQRAALKAQLAAALAARDAEH